MTTQKTTAELIAKCSIVHASSGHGETSYAIHPGGYGTRGDCQTILDRIAELEADKVNTINLCGDAVKREIDELMAKPDIAGTPAAELLSVAYDNIALALVDMKPQAMQAKVENINA